MTLTDFKPTSVSEEAWAEIGGFVRDLALTAAPLTAYTAHRLAVTLTSYLEWACYLRGMPQDVTVVLKRSTIDRYVDYKLKSGALSEGTLRNYRSMLRRVQEALAPTPAFPTARTLNKRNSIDPYSEEEVRLLKLWSTGQNTDLKVHKGMTTLALALGAGLRAKEVIELTADRVIDDDLGILIRLDDRDVPLLAEWETTLRHVLKKVAPSDRIFGPSIRTRNVLSGFVDTTKGSIRPTSSRMRATWIVTHLRAGTHIRSLMTAAGVEKFENLVHYLQFVPELDTLEYRTALRLQATQ